MILFRKAISIALATSTLILAGQVHSQEEAVDIAALQAEVDRLKSIVPGQAVAMTQVAYNFSNLWFAVEAENWALANFYVNETRVRLRWAIRISPTARTPGGQVDYQPFLDQVEEPYLAEISQMIADQNAEGFAATYDDTLNACYGCHVGVGRDYLTLSRPTRPAEALIDFNAP